MNQINIITGETIKDINYSPIDWVEVEENRNKEKEKQIVLNKLLSEINSFDLSASFNNGSVVIDESPYDGIKKKFLCYATKGSMTEWIDRQYMLLNKILGS